MRSTATVCGHLILPGRGRDTMKRWLVGLLLIAIAGCGGGSSSPDGSAVPTPEDSQAKVDKSPAQTGQETFIFQGHSRPVLSVSFSPDGKRIVSGSFDRTVKVWDISSLDTSK